MEINLSLICPEMLRQKKPYIDRIPKNTNRILLMLLLEIIKLRLSEKFVSRRINIRLLILLSPPVSLTINRFKQSINKLYKKIPFNKISNRIRILLFTKGEKNKDR